MSVRMKKGQFLIQEVCTEFAVKRDRLIGGKKRRRKITRARCALILRMKDCGVPVRNIARILKINVSTVKYHLYPKSRERIRRNASALYRQRRGSFAHTIFAGPIAGDERRIETVSA